MATTLEIIQGLAQAASRAYDGAHMENYNDDGRARIAKLQREEGDPILDRRVMDGFKVRFSGPNLIISYQSEIKLKEVYAGGFENEIDRRLNEIKKFLQKEYKAITGKSVTLTADGEPKVLAQSTSRVRSFVQAYQHYKIRGVKEEPILDPAVENSRSITRKFLEQVKTAKRPSNEFIKKGDNQK